MEKIFDLEHFQGNLEDILYETLKKQRKEDIEFINSKYNGGELEEKRDQVEHDFDFNSDKLSYVPELVGRDESIKRKFVEMLLYIDELPINKGNKIDTILTFGAMISKIPTHVELLDNETAYFLSTAMMCLPLDCYETYGAVVSNPTLLKSIKQKTPDMNERRNMIYDIFDYCDDVIDEDMNQVIYDNAIKDSMEIVTSYVVKSDEKKK